MLACTNKGVSIINLVFKKSPSTWARFAFFLLLSLTLILFDHRQGYLTQVRSWLGVVTTPIYWISDVPVRVVTNIRELMTLHNDLLEENARLKVKNLILAQKLQKYAALTVQNQQLRELLNSSQPVEEHVLVAELISIDPNPQIRQVVINKGSLDDVYIGQPVLDASGILGQVISVSLFVSRVLLVTDEKHRVPVQINRNGYRAIASGNSNALELLYVPHTADIKKGDLLVSSGLGERFPFGYPVGIVKAVTSEAGLPFATVTADPVARLNHSRLVMLVFIEEKKTATQE